MKEAKQINQQFHANKNFDNSLEKLKFSMDKLGRGEATISTDTYNGRKLISVKFDRQSRKEQRFGFHLPLHYERVLKQCLK